MAALSDLLPAPSQVPAGGSGEDEQARGGESHHEAVAARGVGREGGAHDAAGLLRGGGGRGGGRGVRVTLTPARGAGAGGERGGQGTPRPQPPEVAERAAQLEADRARGFRPLAVIDGRASVVGDRCWSCLQCGKRVKVGGRAQHRKACERAEATAAAERALAVASVAVSPGADEGSSLPLRPAAFPDASWAWAEAQAAHPTAFEALARPTWGLRFQRDFQKQGRLLERYCMSLEAVSASLRGAAAFDTADAAQRRRLAAWWLILAAPRMLWRQEARGGVKRTAAAKDSACERFRCGKWQELWAEVQAAEGRSASAQSRQRRGEAPVPTEVRPTPQELARVCQAALRKLQSGDYRGAMARLMSTSGVLAGSAEVLAKLEALHPVAGALPDTAKAVFERLIGDLVGMYARRAAGFAPPSVGAEVVGGGAAAPAPPRPAATASLVASEGSLEAWPPLAPPAAQEAGRRAAADAAAAAVVAVMEASVRATERIELAAACQDRDCRLDLLEDSVLTALRSAKRGTSGGGSGWLTEHLKRFALDGGPAGKSFVVTVLRRVACGTLPGVVADALGSSVLTALDKDGEGVTPRPIAVGDVIHRAAFRAVCVQYGKRFEEVLSPLQYGVHVRGGGEQIIQAIRLLLAEDPSRIVIRADVKNAFNSLHRAPLFDQLLRHFPELLPGVGAFYLGQGKLFFRREDGSTETLLSISGVRQGDPLGPVLFALGIHPALVEVERRFRAQGIFVFAYADDVHLVGPPAVAYEAFCLLRALLGEAAGFPHGHLSVQPAGVSMSAGKCHAWGQDGLYPAAMRADVDITIASAAGFLVLGVPLAAQAEMQAATLARATGTAKPRQFGSRIVALRRLASYGGVQGAPAALILARVCALPSLTYLLRVLPPEVTAQAAAAADKLLLGLVCLCAGGSATAAADALLLAPGSWRARVLALPMQEHFGGFALPSAVTAAPLAYVGSWLAAAPAVAMRVPPLRAAISPVYLAAQAGAQAALDEAQRPDGQLARALVAARAAADVAFRRPSAAPPPSVPLAALQRSLSSRCISAFVLPACLDLTTAAAALTLEAGPQPGWQHRLSMAWAVDEYAAVQAAARSEDSSAEALTHFKGRAVYGAMAFATLLPQRGVALAGPEFATVLRRQLRLPIPGLLGRKCPRCHTAVLDAFGDHIDTCGSGHMHGLHMGAHNAMRDAVFEVARKAGFLGVRFEPPGLVEGTRERPADVLLPGSNDLGLGRAQHQGLDCCVDVVRIHQLCPSYVSQPRPEEPMLRAALRKDGRPGLPPTAFVYGFAFSSLGGLLRERAAPFLGACAAQRQRSDLSAEEGSGDAMATQMWLPRLSVAAHRGSYRMIRALLAPPGALEAIQPLSDLVHRADGRLVGAAGHAAFRADPDSVG